MVNDDRGRVDDADLASRRVFLGLLAGGGAALVAGLMGVPVIGFLLAPLFRRPPEVWRDVGAVGDFEVGEFVEVVYEDRSSRAWAGIAARTGAWLRRINASEFVAFSIHCTHLGCPVRWIDSASLFMCPCHGGVFHENGTPAAGPPPRPLVSQGVRVRNGRVEVEASGIPITPGALRGDA